MTPETDRWFAELPSEQSDAAKALRDIVLSSDPRMREELKWKQPCYSIHAMICYIQKARAHLSIGFREGVRLNDPAGILRGDGAQLRHVRLRNGEEIDRPAIAALLAQALELDAMLSEKR